MHQRYSLDNSWRRPKKGNVLIAGSPLRIFRLSTAGQAIAESLEQNGEAPSSGQLLVTRLIDAGALHPLPSLEADTPTVHDISIVIPLFARSENDISRVQNFVAEFSAFPHVVVVDDAFVGDGFAAFDDDETEVADDDDNDEKEVDSA